MIPRRLSPSFGIGLQSVNIKWNIKRQSMPNPAAGRVIASG